KSDLKHEMIDFTRMSAGLVRKTRMISGQKHFVLFNFQSHVPSNVDTAGIKATNGLETGHVCATAIHHAFPQVNPSSWLESLTFADTGVCPNSPGLGDLNE